jgi:hypothetical protein
MAEKMRVMTSHRDGRGDDDDDDNDNDDEGAPSNVVRWEYSIDYCNASGFASSKFESLWTKRHRRGRRLPSKISIRRRWQRRHRWCDDSHQPERHT